MTQSAFLNGFREYDARWRFPEDIDLSQIQRVGQAIGTQMSLHGVGPQIVLGHDLRSYSPAVKEALEQGLIAAGAQVADIGLCLSPTAYFAQQHLSIPAVAMVTASHNPNGWTGIKIGFATPCTHGPKEMAELKDIVQNARFVCSDKGHSRVVDGINSAYLDDLLGEGRLQRPLKVVCATGNGTAGAFAPDMFERLGAQVIKLHCELDPSFPNYNPNPESLEMLNDMALAVRAHGADIGFGFDGDGDRCGVVDELGNEVFADKMGLLLARHFSSRFSPSHFVVDIKSTGLFATDPVLHQNGATAEYWKTGHSHMKRRVKEKEALAGFEKSGHYFIAPPLGRGYDCGLRAAVEICRLLDDNSSHKLSNLVAELGPSWTSPTMSPACADHCKYEVVSRLMQRFKQMKRTGDKIAGRSIKQIMSVNGARVMLDDGSWALVRASSNTPNLVVVCESVESDQDLGRIFQDFDAILREEPEIGAYDQDLKGA